LPVSEAQRNGLLLVLSEKLADSALVGKTDWGQNYCKASQYYRKDEWDKLGDPGVASGVKLQIVCDKFRRLRCKYPSEHTAQTATALFLTASDGLDRALVMSAMSKFETFKHVKAVLKKTCATAESSREMMLPEPAAFQARYPGIWNVEYALGPPVALPHSEPTFHALEHGVPMRATNREVRENGQGFSGVLPRSNTSGMHMMQAFMQMMAQAVNSPRQGECNLEWATPKARPRPGTGTGLEMLEGTPTPAIADAPCAVEVPDVTVAVGAVGSEKLSEPAVAADVAAAAGGAAPGEVPKDTPRMTAEDTTARLLAALRDREPVLKALNKFAFATIRVK